MENFRLPKNVKGKTRLPRKINFEVVRQLESSLPNLLGRRSWFDQRSPTSGLAPVTELFKIPGRRAKPLSPGPHACRRQGAVVSRTLVTHTAREGQSDVAGYPEKEGFARRVLRGSHSHDTKLSAPSVSQEDRIPVAPPRLVKTDSKPRPPLKKKKKTGGRKPK